MRWPPHKSRGTLARMRIREQFRSLPSKAKTLVGILLTIAVDRALKIWVPEGQEANFIVRALQRLRHAMSLIDTKYLIGAALAAAGLYLWDERKRLSGSVRTVWNQASALGGHTVDNRGGIGMPTVTVESPPQLSQAQKDRKLPALDAVRDTIRRMHPFINRGEQLQGGLWNAYATRSGDEFVVRLRDFRDELEAEVRTLTELRHRHSEYQDIVAATDLSDWESWHRAMSDYLVISQVVRTYVREGAQPDTIRLFSGQQEEAFHVALVRFIRWHNEATARLDQICRVVAA